MGTLIPRFWTEVWDCDLFYEEENKTVSTTCEVKFFGWLWFEKCYKVTIDAEVNYK